jgi:hypothetical protein
MLPSSLIEITKWEVSLFLFGLAAIIFYRLLTGKINTRHLLYGRRPDGTTFFSPEKVQLLVATFSIASQYLVDSSRAAPGKMPDLPTQALELLGLSNAIYLGRKSWTFLKEKQRI